MDGWMTHPENRRFLGFGILVGCHEAYEGQHGVRSDVRDRRPQQVRLRAAWQRRKSGDPRREISREQFAVSPRRDDLCTHCAEEDV